jgi:hypothetical protein
MHTFEHTWWSCCSKVAWKLERCSDQRQREQDYCYWQKIFLTFLSPLGECRNSTRMCQPRLWLKMIDMQKRIHVFENKNFVKSHVVSASAKCEPTYVLSCRISKTSINLHRYVEGKIFGDDRNRSQLHLRWNWQKIEFTKCLVLLSS